MFERFTSEARNVIVRAQEEARALDHDHIGTEHVLLGLLAVREGTAARLLAQSDVVLDGVREEVRGLVGPGAGTVGTHIPFTARAKKVLEFALREAVQMRVNYIGTEHILLGVLREAEGYGAQILTKRGIAFEDVRKGVAMQKSNLEEGAAVVGGTTETVPVRAGIERALHPACPRCRGALEETALFKTLDIPEDDGDGTLQVRVVFCGACGTVLFEA